VMLEQHIPNVGRQVVRTEPIMAIALMEHTHETDGRDISKIWRGWAPTLRVGLF
jgi:hypothetical protein